MSPAPEPFYVQVGRRIHGLRTGKGLTQAEVGLRLDPPVTRASIANLENGRQRLLLHTFVQIAEILECRLDDLVPAGVSREANGDLQTEVAGELKKYSIPSQARSRISRQLLMPTRKDKT
jgi:transcriptional regulator with XRE-family HTH domain